jgi:hypothetical protein
VADSAVDYLAAGQTLTQTYAVTVTDTFGATATENVVITITGSNDTPVAVTDTVSATEDTVLTGTLIGNDIPSGDGGNIWSKASDPIHGAVVVNADGSFTYMPALNYNGPDSFSYTITDVDGSTSTATVDVTMLVVNDPPVALNDRAHSPDGRPVTVTALNNDADLDGDTLTISRIDGVSVAAGSTVTIPEGTVTVNADGTLTFAPNPGMQGNAVFSYEISDGHGGAAAANVTISVVPAAPVLPPALPPLLESPMLTVSAGVSVGRTPLSDGEQAREPSVFFDGATFDRILRMPIPFHPVAFTNAVVEHAQLERATSDPLLFSDPAAVRSGEIQSQSIGAGLGFDLALFVQHAVRDSRAEGDFLNHVVNGRLSRLNLSSDRLIPTPELAQSGLPQSVALGPVADLTAAPERAAADVPAPPDIANDKLAAGSTLLSKSHRTAPSFSEQLRGASTRAAVTARAPLRTRAIL